MSEEEFYELGRKVVEYRAKHDLSQAEFAKLCNLSTQTVHLLENGKQYPTELTRTKIMLKIKEDD
jgi:DNA-binding XRE family transcriptional regulator